MFTIAPVTPVIGAEVGDFDMTEALDEQTRARLDDALVEHKVLIFRDQHDLTPQAHIAFGRAFGELTVEPYSPRVPGHDDLTLFVGHGADRYKESWHSDMYHEPEPPMASILRAVDIPPTGRDTLWANMEAVYDDLSDNWQRFLSDLVATVRLRPKHLLTSDSPEPNPVEHPVVRTHPVSGRKSIFVNPVYTSEIVGMRERESRAVLEFLYDQTRDPEYQMRVRWQPGTVVMWDNRSVQHRLIIDLPPEATTRELHRVTIRGDKPF